jgi:hypothetical protein
MALSNPFTIRIQAAASGTPTWWPAVNTVAAIPLTQSAQTVADASTSQRIALTAYSGGAKVTIGGRPYLLVKGGGHNDSEWNGIVMIGPLDSSTPTSSIVLAGSTSFQDAARYADGRPSASHTYNMLVGVGSTLYQTGNDARYQNAFGSAFTTAYTQSGFTDLATMPRGSGSAYGGSNDYSGYLFHMESSSAGDACRLRRYNIANNTWDTEPGAGITVEYDQSGSTWHGYLSLPIDTTRGVALAINEQVCMGWRTLTGTIARRTGANRLPVSLWYDNHCCYVGGTYDRYVCMRRNTRTIYTLDAAAFANWVQNGGTAPSWEASTLGGVTPPVPGSTNGIFGRSQWYDFPGLGGGPIYYADQDDTSAYIYRVY